MLRSIALLVRRAMVFVGLGVAIGALLWSMRSVRRRSKHEEVCFIVWHLTLLLPHCSQAQTNWNAAAGSWFDPVNWTAGLPTSSTDALINNNGTALIDSPGAVGRDLIVGNSATGELEISSGGALVTRYGKIGELAGSIGTATIIGENSVWSTSRSLSVGSSGSGRLIIANGGRASTLRNGGFIGYQASSVGEIIVSGCDSQMTNSGLYGALHVGFYGTGALTIESGGTVSNVYSGTVGTFSGSRGTVLINGSGSTWTNNSGLEVGSRGHGELMIDDGGKVFTADGAWIGSFPGSEGDVALFGSGSEWTVGEDLHIGYQGQGTLTISEGAAVSNTNGSIGAAPASQGVVKVSGNSSIWANSGMLSLGKGDLIISNGGTVFSAGGALSNMGKVSITNVNSAWTNNSSLLVGSVGAAEMTIAEGGLVSNKSATLGQYSGAEGTVTVSGSGSIWTTSGELIIGLNGTGMLAIISDGMVNVEQETFVARNPSGQGSIYFDNGTLTTRSLLVPASSLIGNGVIAAHGLVTDIALVFDQNHGLQQQITLADVPNQHIEIDVNVDGSGVLGAGYSGQGSLTIADGLTVESRDGYLGYHSISNGTALVTGLNSTWITSSLTVGNSGMGQLTIADGGVVSGSVAIVGGLSGSDGSVAVAGNSSSWMPGQSLTVGENGTGELRITQGGVVSNGLATIGKNGGSDGTVTITGNSTWTTDSSLVVGGNGTGRVTISEAGLVSSTSGIIGSSAAATGAMLITGDGSTWANGGPLTIGGSGIGNMVIADGGVISSTITSIGEAHGSEGTVTVMGAGSVWTNSGTLTIGNEGTGMVNIMDYGLVEVGQTTYVGRSSGAGSIQFENGTLTTGTLFAARGELSGTGSIDANGLVSDIDLVFDEDHGLQQQVIVESGPAQEITINLDVDGTGAIGTGYRGESSLTITDGVNVSSTAGYLGYWTGSKGTASVSGVNSAWIISGQLAVGSSSGIGDLTIENGAMITNGSGNIGNGKVSVTGKGSSWSNSSLMIGGFSATGAELLVTDGGQVSSAQSTSSIFPSGIAAQSGTNGKVTVSGTGSTWTHEGVLTVGGDGNGVLTISGGSHVASTSGSIGGSLSSLSGSGVVTVTGIGSLWTNSGALTVGNRRPGTLNISDGGRVICTSGAIAANFGSTGSVNVSGNGAKWSISGGLAIAGFSSSATGTLTIGLGGSVSVSGETLIGSAGQLRLEGGEFSTGSIRFQLIGGEFNWTSGTLHVGTYNGNLTNSSGVLAPGNSAGRTVILGSYTQNPAATLQIEVGGELPTLQHDFVNVTSSVALDGTLQLALLDGYVPNVTATFTVVTSGGNITGAFVNVVNRGRLATSDGMGSFLVHYGASSIFDPKQIVLSGFELAGDFNGDSIVDAADYVAWRKRDGSQEGYDAWRANFGRSVGTSGSAASMDTGEPPAAAVPEPRSSVLLSFGLLAIWLAGRLSLQSRACLATTMMQ